MAILGESTTYGFRGCHSKAMFIDPKITLSPVVMDPPQA